MKNLLVLVFMVLAAAAAWNFYNHPNPDPTTNFISYLLCVWLFVDKIQDMTLEEDLRSQRKRLL
jgi:hypothetical protein